MRIDLACFSEHGRALADRLAERLRADGDEAQCARCGGNGGHAPGVGEWAAEHFPATDALVFIGAAGIAVRAVAPLLRGKTRDPAVVVIDDCGRFAVSLLSGHLGGANELAVRLAAILGATPVVTTATDNAGVFAVDTWAQRRGFFIANPERIKTISARVLAGGPVRLWSAVPVAEKLPDAVIPSDRDGADIDIDIFRSHDEHALHLVPRTAVLGIGCRKDAPQAALEHAFRCFCEQTNIHPQAFAKVCSIDLKQDEPGLIAFCAARALPFETFSAETLARQPGAFAASDFVASVAGVGTVCERAAVAGGGGGALLVGKTVIDSVAFAAAAYGKETA